MAVQLDFTGHDSCADYPGSSTEGSVLAPVARGSIAAFWSFESFFKDWDFTPLDICAPQQPAPGCNVFPPLVRSGEAIIKKAGQTVRIDYTFFAAINDFPHLTHAGQQAVAADIRLKLGL